MLAAALFLVPKHRTDPKGCAQPHGWSTHVTHVTWRNVVRDGPDQTPRPHEAICRKFRAWQVLSAGPMHGWGQGRAPCAELWAVGPQV